MKKILVFGNGPLPEMSPHFRSAVQLRTQQFVDSLEEEGHSYFLFLITDQQGVYKEGEKYLLISRSHQDLFKCAKKWLHSSAYDLVLGVNTFPAYVASKCLNRNTPFWADLNGWIMAEMEAQSAGLGHDSYLSHGWNQERSILLRADQISTVSTPQKFAVLGEAASLGRVNRSHFGRKWIHVIPNALPSAQAHEFQNSEKDSLFRGKIVPREAFVVAQIGGFNNWCDEKTLFHALEKAISQDSNIYFVSTGGAIDHIAEHPFERFKKRVDASSFRDHFHFLGWVDSEKMPFVYHESDIGILADIFCTETETGARNRINEMIAYGIPVLMTEGSEISYDISSFEGGKVVKSGNIELLAEAILTMKQGPELRLRFSQNAQKVAISLWSPQKTMKSFREWTKKSNYNLAHTKRVFLQTNVKNHIFSAVAFYKERGGRAFFQKLYQKLWRK